MGKTAHVARALKRCSGHAADSRRRPLADIARAMARFAIAMTVELPLAMLQ